MRPAERPRPHRGPFRLAVSGSVWRGAAYLLAYLVVGWVLFSVVVTAAVTAAVLAVTIAGLPVLIAAAGTIRGCANVERGLLRTLHGEPVHGRYRPVTRPGITAQVKTRWLDSATWRDIAYLAGLFVPLMIMDVTVLAIWLVLLAGITLPAWYWAPEQTFPGGTQHGVQLGYFPNGPHSHGAWGLYVDTLPKALAAAAACLVLWLLFNYVLAATARAHGTVARALLRPAPDPLAGAKEMLSRPGPLPPLVPAPQNHPAGPPGPASPPQ